MIYQTSLRNPASLLDGLWILKKKKGLKKLRTDKERETRTVLKSPKNKSIPHADSWENPDYY
jgi:hypothetical protein